LTYENLLEENQRLKAALGNTPPLDECDSRVNGTQSIIDDDVEIYELVLFESKSGHPGRSDDSWSDFMLPSRECSSAIIQYSAIWISWVHYALDHSQFEKEHDAFWDALESGLTMQNHKPSWLAIYFSVISVSICNM